MGMYTDEQTAYVNTNTDRTEVVTASEHVHTDTEAEKHMQPNKDTNKSDSGTGGVVSRNPSHGLWNSVQLQVGNLFAHQFC
jgi:hypothetical protein